MDDARRIPRSGGMFSYSSLAKADLATNLAIQLLADGGWPALTLRNIAQAGNVTPQAIAAWFPSATAMRAAIAGRYGERWIRERGRLAHGRLPVRFDSTEQVTLAQVAIALLPATWLEEAFAGVWLTIVEASRWDDTVRAHVAVVRTMERDMVLDLLGEVECRDDAQRGDLADMVLALTQGLGMASAKTGGPVTLERAPEVVQGALSGART